MANPSKPTAKTRGLRVVDTSAQPPAETAPSADRMAEISARAVSAALDKINADGSGLITRSSLRREKHAQALREVDLLILELNDREDMLERTYEAARKALAAQREDLEAERALLTRGLEAASITPAEAAQ